MSRHVLSRPSIKRASVEQLAPVVAAERDAQQVERAEREAVRAQRRGLRAAPDDGHEWLDTTTTALMLGVTANRVRQMSVADRIPFTNQAGRRWYRRDHVEQLAAARAFAGRADVVGH